MASRLLYHAAGPLLGAVIPLGAYAFLRLQPSLDPRIVIPVHHFSIVSAVALIAAATAVAVGLAGGRLRNIQVIFLAMAFTSLALLFALHGLSTPGFILPLTHLPAVSAELSVLLTVFWLWMSVLPADHPLICGISRRQSWLVPLWTTLLAGFVLVAVRAPTLVEWAPIDQLPLRAVVSGFSVTLALVVAFRYWQSYRYSRFPLQIAVVYGAGWLAVAQVIMSTGELWRLSWWIYHFLLLAAMVLLVAGLTAQYGTGTSIGVAVRGLFNTDLQERIEAAISPSVRALVVATETRDRYTAGHSLRVALSAMRLGQALGLPPEKLRALAQGAIVHDVGKLEVPDQVLNKPGALTPEERAIIERHTITGYEMCSRLGFMKDELDIIRSHHERWDGTGYPDRLKGPEIPLLARILAVADVYDALTSERSYRRPWSHDEARQYLSESAGTQFDPECVAIWLQMTETDPLPQETLARQRAGETGSSLEAGVAV